MARDPLPTWTFALVVVRLGPRFLLVHERKHGGRVRMRVIFHAHPADDPPPKAQPDEESLEAGWFLVSQMRTLSLGGGEVLRLFEDVERGAPIYPLSLLRPEGEPLLPG